MNNLVIKISDEKGNNLPATNPNTDSNLSIFIILFSIEILIILGVVIYLIKNKKLNIETIKKMKKVNIISMTVFLGLTLLTLIGYSYALETAEIKVNSKVKISKARLARNCSSDTYTIEQTGYCINWNRELSDEGVSHLIEYETGVITEQTKTMPEIYNFQDINFKLITTKDVSDLQNKEVILGVYEAEDEDLTLLIIGQDGGVIAPVDMSYMFATDVILPSSLEDEDEKEIPKEVIDENRYLDVNIMLMAHYMNLNNIKTNDVNNMSGMFVNSNGERLGLDKWNTDNVKDMSSMFYRVVPYSHSVVDGLSNFNTTNVTNMSKMFYNFQGELLKGGISNWNTSNVKDISYMFYGAFQEVEEFDISKWNTENVVDMSHLFEADAFVNINKLDISKWNTSKVKDMSFMFSRYYYGEQDFINLTNFDISKWDTSNVENMSYMFAGALNNLKTFDISNWDVSNVQSTNHMFYESLNGLNKFDISKWNVSNVTDMSYLFYDSLNSLTKFDISNWDVSNVDTMSHTFGLALNSVQSFDISNWDVSNVTSMSYMFGNALSNVKELGISHWNVSNVKYMNGMFYGGLNNCEKLDLSPWDTSNIDDISGMFAYSFENAKIKELNLTSFDFNQFDFDNYVTIFRGIAVPTDMKIYVKDESQKKWILYLNSGNIYNSRPPELDASHIFVVE